MRSYTDAEIREIVALIWDTVESTNANIFGGYGQPIFTRFETLTPGEQEQGFQGLKDRIQRETLRGYINRKRDSWGERAYTAVLYVLEARGLIESPSAPPVSQYTGERPFPQTYNDWVGLAYDIKEKDKKIDTWTKVHECLNSIAFDEPDIDDAKRWLVNKANELGIG